MRLLKFAALALLIFFVVFSAPQPSLASPEPVDRGPGPADYAITPSPTLTINGSDVYVKFLLKGSVQTVHGIIYGKPLGSSVVALYLPGFRRDAERSIEDFRNRNREPDYTLIVLDPPGKGSSTGPAQELDNVLGDGKNPDSSYIRRYMEFAYATIRAFYSYGTPIAFVAGHSMGATTIMALVTIDDPALAAVSFYAPMAIAGFRLRSIRDGTFLNRFTRDPDKDTRLIKYFDVASFPEKVRYDIVMINGMHDRVYSIRTMVRTAKILGSKLVSHVLVPDAGHRMCKAFAESFSYRIHKYLGDAPSSLNAEKVYDNDRLHYSGPIRLTPGDYVFRLYYVEQNGEKVYVSSEVISDSYSRPMLFLYVVIILLLAAYLTLKGEFLVAFITVFFSYRRFRAPGRFIISLFGKLFRRMVPLEILIAASFVYFRRKYQLVPIIVLLIIGNAITLALMHSVLLPGPYLAILILYRLARLRDEGRMFVKRLNAKAKKALRSVSPPLHHRSALDSLIIFFLYPYYTL